MIPIYITAFNRPFYLDRCLWSIKEYVANYDCIKILDGGTPAKYMDRIKEKYPEIEIIVSRDEAYDFWIREIEKDNFPYFCYIHDDQWFTEYIDLEKVAGRMQKYNLPGVKLIYGTEFNNGIDTELIDYIEIFKPDFNKHLWQAWLCCMMVFTKEYWLAGYKPNESKAGKGWVEDAMVKGSNDYLIANDLRMGRMMTRYMRQGQAIGVRSDILARYGSLRQHLILNAVNEAWYNREFNIQENFPKEFSTRYLECMLREYNVPVQDIEAWKRIRETLLDETNFLI